MADETKVEKWRKRAREIDEGFDEAQAKLARLRRKCRKLLKETDQFRFEYLRDHRIEVEFKHCETCKKRLDHYQDKCRKCHPDVWHYGHSWDTSYPKEYQALNGQPILGPEKDCFACQVTPRNEWELS